MHAPSDPLNDFIHAALRRAHAQGHRMDKGDVMVGGCTCSRKGCRGTVLVHKDKQKQLHASGTALDAPCPIPLARHSRERARAAQEG